jgi:hypothetical protein
MRMSFSHLLPFAFILTLACGGAKSDPASSTAPAGGTAPATGAAASAAPATAPAAPAPPAPRNELTGRWVASLFDLDLKQNADRFTGTLCGDRNRCFSIEEGQIVGNKLTAAMYETQPEKKQMGSLELTKAADGKRLVGKLVDAARRASCEANKIASCNDEIVLAMTRDDGSECELLGSVASAMKSSAPADATVSGKWKAEGREIGAVALDLTQGADAVVTGQSCSGSTCIALDGGKAVGGVFSACYAYRERNKRELVRYDLALSADGQTLEGKLMATEGGSANVMFNKQP